MMTLISILLILGAVFFIIRALIKLQAKKLSYNYGILWIALWLLLIGIILLPKVESSLANLFGIQKGLDAFVYIAILGLFYWMFRLYEKLEKINTDITAIVRETAKKNVRKSKK